MLLVISVPPGNRAAANGMLISEEHLADRSIYRWKHKHPMAAYLVGVSVTNYAGMTEKVPAFAGMTEKALVRRLLSGRTLLRVWPGISIFAYDQDRRII